MLGAHAHTPHNHRSVGPSGIGVGIYRYGRKEYFRRLAHNGRRIIRFPFWLYQACPFFAVPYQRHVTCPEYALNMLLFGPRVPAVQCIAQNTPTLLSDSPLRL
jgi:hypothetical protein